MVWLLASLTAIIGILLAWGNYKICNLKRLLKESEQWDIHNFRKIELSYVEGNDILANPSVVNKYFVPSKNVPDWLESLHLKRSGALIELDDKRFFKDGQNDLFLVSVEVSRPYIEHWTRDASEVLRWNEEKNHGWSALQEFLILLRHDLAYGDSHSSSYTQARVTDLVILLGAESEIEILRIVNGNICNFKKEVFEKMQRIRTVIDVRKRAGYADGHFEFLMSKNVGFDKDRRIVDLIDDDKILEKICGCFQELEKKV